jgi:hypothetical protein
LKIKIIMMIIIIIIIDGTQAIWAPTEDQEEDEAWRVGSQCEIVVSKLEIE